MSPLPSSLLSAARSGDVRGSFLAVFVELHEWLDADEFRPVKPWSVADRLHMKKSTVYCALEALAKLGYVEQGEPFGNARTYRLRARQQRVA